MSGDDLKQAVQRKMSFVRTMQAVAWGFFGVRKGVEWEKDLKQLNPVHLIIAGVIGAALFMVVLLVVVNWVLASGVAK